MKSRNCPDRPRFLSVTHSLSVPNGLTGRATPGLDRYTCLPSGPARPSLTGTVRRMARTLALCYVGAIIMNRYYKRCIPVYVSSVLLGIVADLINNFDAENQISHFTVGFFILIPLGVTVLSEVIPRLEVKSVFAAAVWGATIMFFDMVFAFWFYAYRRPENTGDMYGVVYLAGAIPAVIAGALYGIVLLRKTPDHDLSTARTKRTIRERILRGGSASLLFISCVFLVSAVTPLITNPWGLPSNDFVGLRNAILMFGTYGSVLALPSAILMLIKISDRKERNVTTPKTLPIIAGTVFGTFIALYVALKSQMVPEGFFFLLLAFGSLLVLKLYFSERFRARIQAFRGRL